MVIYETIYETYIKISDENYTKYLKSKKEYDDTREEVEKKRSDIEHCLSDKLQKKYEGMLEFAIVSVLFQALAIESVVNCLGLMLYGKSDFEDYYERLSINQKVRLFYKQATSCNPEIGKEPFQSISKLISLRNGLAHAKAHYNNSGSIQGCGDNLIDSQLLNFIGTSQGLCNKYIDEINKKTDVQWFKESHAKISIIGRLEKIYIETSE